MDELKTTVNVQVNGKYCNDGMKMCDYLWYTIDRCVLHGDILAIEEEDNCKIKYLRCENCLKDAK